MKKSQLKKVKVDPTTIRDIDNYITNRLDGNESPLFNPTPVHYAAIYARISGKSDSFSIPSQIEACKKYIEKNNLILYDVYTDKKSATQVHFYERKGFKKLLSDMEAGMFKNLVIIRRDRLSRRIDDFMQLRRIFNRHNVKVFYVKEGNLNFDTSSYVTHFLENILMSISTLEPEYIYQRTKGGRQNLRNEGKFQCGLPPFGYNKVKNKKHKFKINEAEGSLVKKIFIRYKESVIKNGNPIKCLVEEIKQYKIDKKLDNPKNINNSFINRIIKRSIYGGKMIIKEEYHIDDCVRWDSEYERYVLEEEKFIKCENFAPIITWDTWKEVFLHYYLSKNGPLGKEYLFKNLLVCNNCKGFIGLDGNKYRCSNNCIEIPLDDVIRGIFKEIIHSIDTNQLKQIFVTRVKDITKRIDRQNKALNSKRDAMRSLINDYIDLQIEENSENYASYMSKIEATQNEISAIQDKINQLGGDKLSFINISTNINSFKIHFGDAKGSDIDFIKDSWITINHMISKFVSQVVIKKVYGKKFRYKIKYK